LLTGHILVSSDVLSARQDLTVPLQDKVSTAVSAPCASDTATSIVAVSKTVAILGLMLRTAIKECSPPAQ